MATLISMLKSSSGAKGRVVATEAELVALFVKNKCSTKSAMIKAMSNAGYAERDIAVTLLKYGVLSEKSARQHVYNTLHKS